MRLSLRLRLLALSLLLAIGPLALGAVFSVRWLVADKEAFVYQLESFAATAAAREADDHVGRASERLGQLATISADATLPPEERRRLAARLFESSGFLVATAGTDAGTLFDARDEEALAKAGIPAASLLALPSWAPDDGSVLVRNATLSPALPLVAVARLVPGAGSAPLRAAAIFPASAILDVAAWSSPYEAFVVDREGKLLVHQETGRVAAREDLSRLSSVRQARAGASGASAYPTPGGSMLGGYAPVRTGGLVVVLELPEAAVTETVSAFVRKALALIGAMLAISAVLAILLARSVAGPVGTLTKAAQALSRGDFTATLPPAGPDEIGQLAAAFERMRSDLAAREQQLAEAQESLVQSEKLSALGQLAAGITHEIKNPMAGIIGFAQLALKLAPADSPLLPHLKTIEREGKRSKEILDNLLRFARKEELTLELRDLSEVVLGAHKLVAHQLQLAKIRAELKLGTGLPQVRVNETQLQQVLMNLQLNAMHAMQPKGGKLELSTYAAPDGRLIVAVKDEGHGIKEEDRKKLFTPFFTTKEKGQGTGLGLSISYRIVESHGGELRVFSEVGVGTTFYVYLPVAPAPAPASG